MYRLRTDAIWLPYTHLRGTLHQSVVGRGPLAAYPGHREDVGKVRAVCPGRTWRSSAAPLGARVWATALCNSSPGSYTQQSPACSQLPPSRPTPAEWEALDIGNGPMSKASHCWHSPHVTSPLHLSRRHTSRAPVPTPEVCGGARNATRHPFSHVWHSQGRPFPSLHSGLPSRTPAELLHPRPLLYRCPEACAQNPVCGHGGHQVERVHGDLAVGLGRGQGSGESKQGPRSSGSSAGRSSWVHLGTGQRQIHLQAALSAHRECGMVCKPRSGADGDASN